MSRDFPRLLIATEFPSNAPGGGPVLVAQMLKGWPPQRLMWWSCLSQNQRSFPLQVEDHYVARIPGKLYPHRRLTQSKAWILERLWAPWAARHLRATIRDNHPDVIWTIPHQWSIPPMAEVLPACAVPYHVSVHDYPDAHHAEEKFGQRVTDHLVSLFEHLYKRASSRDVISHEMGADLEERTGQAPDEILNAGVEPEDFVYLEKKASSEPEIIRLAHAGTIVAEATFVRLTESIRRVRQNLSKPIELHLFGVHSYRERSWFDLDWMIEHGNLAPEQFKVKLRGCHWGITPMDLTDENPRYNRFSLPSKVVMYLASGLGIISYGQKNSTITNLARKYSFGVSLEPENESMMDDLLTEGLCESDVWGRYGGEIVRCARTEFDAASMRRTLWAAFGVQR